MPGILKKIIIMIVFTAIFFAASGSYAREKKESVIEKNRIKANKISLMTEYLYFPLSKTQKKRSSTQYDNDGNKIEYVEYDNDGNKIKKTEYKFNKNAVETEYIEYDSVGKVTGRRENKYDAKGNLTEENFYDGNNKLTYIRKYSYDSNGNIFENTLIDRNNKQVGKTAYKYDGNGNKTELVAYNSQNQITGKYAYKYDARNYLSEAATYDKNNAITSKRQYKYDEKGNMLESIGYNAAGNQNSYRKYEYEYYKTEVALEPMKDVPAVAQKKPDAEMNPVNSVPVAQESQTEEVPAKEDNKSKDFVVIFNELKNADYDKTKKIIEENGIDINKQNSFGMSYLMLGVFFGNEGMVRYLAEHGASAELVDSRGHDVKYYLRCARNKNPKVQEIIKNMK